MKYKKGDIICTTEGKKVIALIENVSTSQYYIKYLHGTSPWGEDVLCNKIGEMWVRGLSNPFVHISKMKKIKFK